MTIRSADQGWLLETSTSCYALGLNTQGLLAHRYWGPRLPYDDDYPAPRESGGWASFNGPGQLIPEEYPAYGGVKYIEPCLKVSFADGVRDLVLRFDTVEPHADTLDIHLRDAHYPLRVTLHYRVHAAYDIIERRATIANLGDAPITIERAWSALWHLRHGEAYRLTHATGRWIDEMHLRREPLVQGVKVLDSRRITSGHHNSPWFAADCGDATEEGGEVWFGALAWSGNWKLAAEVTDFGSTRIGFGVNDWDFAWRLGPGELLVTPASYAGYSAEGFGGASRRLHDFIRDNILPDGHAPRKLYYNSWEATHFDIDEASQVQLAEIVAAIGVELFVIDDGWFHGRTNDHAGLGDWWADAQRFPNGLGPLIARVNALGMDFGLWIEPEMVNPDSDLYRAHPDWVIHFPTRARTEARNQLILNLARVDVQDHLIATFDKLLADHKIAYIKWDMNRNVSEPGWPDAPGEQRELWVRYVEGVYRVWGTLRERHPQVAWLSCSGGGGRADLGILRLADYVQSSDNTDATFNLCMLEGYSQILPANAVNYWITDVHAARYSLAFRFHTAMCGVPGIGCNLLRWEPEQRAEAARWIAVYKQIRPIVQNGDMYRLRSAQEHPFSAVQFISKDRAAGVLFAFRMHMPPPATLPPLRLRGLDPQARYEIEGFAEARSGLAWMQLGAQIQLDDFESTLRRIRCVE
jgi:alpha-galactosidase